MTPLVLAVIGGLLALSIWSITASRYALARAVSLLAVLVGAYLGLVGGSVSELNHLGDPVMVQATDNAGASVGVDVVFRAESKAPRSVRRVNISRPVPGSGWIIVAMFLLGLLGLVALIRDDERVATIVLGIFAVCGISMLWIGLSGPEAASGADGVRTYLMHLGESQAVESFSVPDGGWTYPSWGVYPALLVAVFSVFGLLPRPKTFALSEQLIIVSAIVVFSAVIWNVASVGGFVWSGLDGILGLQGFLLALSVVSIQRDEGRGLLIAASAALSVLAV